MIAKDSVVKIQNLVVNHESRPFKSNPESNIHIYIYIYIYIYIRTHHALLTQNYLKHIRSEEREPWSIREFSFK